MFSTLSNFLPSGLQQLGGNLSEPKSPTNEEKGDKVRPVQEEQPSPPVETSMVADELGVRKKKEKSNETFIIVRPPPAKSNHPLNLQVQLVPPAARDRSMARRSTDASESTVGTDAESTLTRTISNRSDTGSLYSTGYSSQASLSSFASTSSGTSGRRMIVPLYNLQAHNVMTNVVVDAGTDAKVARFNKRGMEVIGLAVIEPIELFGAGGNPAPGVIAAGTRRSIDRNFLSPGSPARERSPESQASPGSSALSISSVSHQPHSPPPPPAALPPPPDTPTGAKKLFGKFFKRKESLPPNEPQSPSPFPSSPFSSGFPTPKPKASGHARNSSLTSFKFNKPQPVVPEQPLANKRSSMIVVPPSNEPVSSTNSAILQPPILGIQCALSSPIYPPIGKPRAYIWVVRRWLKGGDNSLLGGVMGKLGNDKKKDREASEGYFSTPQVELRFEWTRGKSASGKKKKGGKKGLRPGSAAGDEAAHERRLSLAVTSSNGPSSTSLETAEHHGNGQAHTKKSKRSSTTNPAVAKRRSVESHRSATGKRGDDDAQSFVTGTDEGTAEGDDSDPEDSETPWTCMVTARRVSTPTMASTYGGSPSSENGPSGRGDEIKVKVAQLKPTPHHPKVVSMLKMPFPLPDIEVDRLRVRKRIVTPAGIARPAPSESGDNIPKGGGTGTRGVFGTANTGAKPSEGLVLTAEEIKDVVSSTGMWLVVREGIGGVGKVSRKGDGWRIRA
ncbi:hypothetical protein JAAARDRAFT_36763 [Jaapia argillacea MUCL 33604]|uniref:Uncharacterized protein n=1 Tax=Jaapia argillacea MUCL 33604 TaxID=933084 RepID=A0A067PXI8_9AGAM|nr:hypothetical protein JAAARDRAFT_36763 [Jaapia argillacea MUCL 33604]